MTEAEIKDLVERYSRAACTGEEAAIVEGWFNDFARKTVDDKPAPDFERIGPELWARIKPQPASRKLHVDLKYMVAVAAAVATIVFGVWFFSPSRHGDNGRHPELVSGSDIAPGKNGATITLSTGEVIRLSEAKKGVIIDPTSLTYDDGSEIASEAAQPRNDGRDGQSRNDGRGGQSRNDGRGGGTGFSLKTETVVQMTATTTKGQTYEFTLPDGTHIFLNADSKITFPSQFSGKERKILLEGEAYFVVKHDEKQPFRVASVGLDGKQQIVEDIGTEFNINAYRDEASIKTTLVEGSARVNETMLSPNQQATNRGGAIKLSQVNAADVAAWKNNKFIFDNDDIRYIMRQVSRWYNVEVIYKEVPNTKFGGTVSRFDNISSVLGILEAAGGVTFKLEGRRVYVGR
ncbi:FecR family protein [Pedobacter sp. GR22-6]|uniref:FecR family protein n=1 Tax=Pedobacter sp. GR22-6 TaxID=3127957 RepID=UPI00307DE2F9